MCIQHAYTNPIHSSVKPGRNGVLAGKASRISADQLPRQCKLLEELYSFALSNRRVCAVDVFIES